MINKIKDERVLEQQRKIGSDAFQLVSYLLLASIIYKQFMINAAISSYMTEVVTLVVGLLYVVLKNILIGNDIYANDTFGTKKASMKDYILNSLYISLTISIALVILDYKNSVFYIKYFFYIFPLILLSSWVLRWVSKIRANKIAQQNEDQVD
ncbi:MAG TPA: DUF6773 family protein [Desulfosporosinus sp.]|nr:DUF6773 family protein [Desulfosporosinus sp.]